MNLLLFNLATDADDPILGFTTDWINRLAPHFEQIDVITMRAGRLNVAPNVSVYSVGKERGLSERQRALEFYRLLLRLIGTRRYAACFAHMMPLFAVMGAPILKVRRVPITLWYTHRQRTRTLDWAARLSDRIVTAAADSFPIPSPKLRVIGHGIDTAFYAPLPDAPPVTDFIVTQVARLMPIKHQETLIRAAAMLPDMRAVFVGDVPPETDSAYKDGLIALAARLGVSDRITFAGALDKASVRDQLGRSAFAVNLSPPGLFDKAALESMAAGVVTLVSSDNFRPLLTNRMQLLSIPTPEDHTALGVKLGALMRLPPEERAQIGREVRARVIKAHDVDGLITRLINVLLEGEP